MEEEYLKHLSQLGASEIETLINKYWKDVWNYCYIMTRQYDMADDITQETFIRAFRALHTFRRESTVKTWLLKIAKHLTINYRRSALFRKIILVDQLKNNDFAPSAESTYLEEQFVDQIWEQVLRLPTKYREVILLQAHYQMSIADMASVLGLSEGTVKSRLHRARLRLDKWLKEEGGGF